MHNPYNLLKQDTRPADPFYESTVYLELYEEFQNLRKESSDFTAILINGPKGCGKTTSLLQLWHTFPNNSLYIDLTPTNVKILNSQSDVISCEDTLYIDNAQKIFDVDGKINLNSQYIIAAFSPGGKVSSSLRKSPFDSLGKSCGDDKWFSFSFRPLKIKECREFVTQILGKRIVEDNMVQNKEIDMEESTFCEVLFFSCGAPRYVKRWLDHSRRKKMLDEMDRQYVQCQSTDMLKRLSLTYHGLRDNIMRLACGGKSSVHTSLCSLGLAYCENEKYYLSNIRHLKLALQDKFVVPGLNWKCFLVHSYCVGTRWQ